MNIWKESMKVNHLKFPNGVWITVDNWQTNKTTHEKSELRFHCQHL